MKRVTSLTAVVILTIALTNWYGDQHHHLAEASSHWSLDNQVKVEERPYTMALKEDPWWTMIRSKANKILSPTLRGMHQFCDGQCFYAPRGCNGFKMDCSVILSVATHSVDEKGELYCDYFGDDALRETFCYNSDTQQKYRNEKGKPDRFYTITLYRNLGARQVGGETTSSCPKRWEDRLGRKCRRKEFVAVSFVNKNVKKDHSDKDNYRSDIGLDINDLWYVCTVDESHSSRVTMWTNFHWNVNYTESYYPPKQIRHTSPHPSGGMGVVFSKVIMDEDVASMGCQFVIQESNMTLPPTITHPKNAAFFGNLSHHPIEVKLAWGYVYRDEAKGDSLIRPFYQGVWLDQSPYRPRDYVKTTFSHFQVYKPDVIKPTSTIAFQKLEVKLVNASADYENGKKTENISKIAMEELINKCDHPTSENYSSLYIACYPPNNQQNCIHTGRCPVMFAVEIPRNETSFKTIKAHLYGIIPETKGLRKTNRRPMGFLSVGFSKDDYMGRDVVITCHADGIDNVGTYVSINFLKANLYPGKVSYDELIYNKVSYASAEENKLLCSWEMETKFVVNMFAYEPDYQQCIAAGESEKLSFDFTKENVTLLFAAGNRNYPGGKINYHDFTEVLNELFSRDLFLSKAEGHIPCVSLLLNVFLLSILYFC